MLNNMVKLIGEGAQEVGGQCDFAFLGGGRVWPVLQLKGVQHVLQLSSNSPSATEFNLSSQILDAPI